MRDSEAGRCVVIAGLKAHKRILLSPHMKNITENIYRRQIVLFVPAVIFCLTLLNAVTAYSQTYIVNQVVVKDTIPPVIVCPYNVVSYTNASSCNRTLSLEKPKISDNSGILSFTWAMTGATILTSDSFGINYVGTKVFNTGVSRVTYLATDLSGNKTSCRLNVIVRDTTRPIFTNRASDYIDTVSTCGKSISIAAATYRDNCGAQLTWKMTGATVKNGSGQIGTFNFNLGTTWVTYQITDAAGNFNTLSFKVVIYDKVKPVLFRSPSSITEVVTSGCAKFVTLKNTDSVIYGIPGPVNIPDSFTFKPFNIYWDGSKAIHNVDLRNEITNPLTRFTVYYCNPTLGNDANNGLTTTAPKKSLYKILMLSGKKVVYVMSGNHDRSNHGLTSEVSKTTLDSTIIIGLGDVVLNNYYTRSYSFSLYGAGTYSTTNPMFGNLTDSIGTVVDYHIPDGDNFATRYKRVYSTKACLDSAGTFYSTTGGRLYIHTLDGRPVDNNIRISNVSYLNFRFRSDNGYLYIQNVKFEGNGLTVANRSDGIANKFDVRLKGCTFAYAIRKYGSANASGSDYGVWSNNTRSIYLQNCIARNGEADGFHYENVSDANLKAGLNTNVLELECSAFNWGNIDKNFLPTPRDASNGTSSHGNTNIYRLNCTYYNNRGQQVSDIGVSDNMLVGCSAWQSTALSTAGRNTDFGVNDGQMYLSHCSTKPASKNPTYYKALSGGLSDGKFIMYNNNFNGSDAVQKGYNGVLDIEDNCPASLTIYWKMSGATTDASPETGVNILRSHHFNLGTTVIQYFITDGTTLLTCAFNVTLVENKILALKCDANLTQATNTCSLPITLNAPVITNTCGIALLKWKMSGATIKESPSTGINVAATQIFNKGTTYVTYSVKNTVGHVASCIQRVVVNSTSSCRPALQKEQKQVDATEKITISLSPNPTNNTFRINIPSQLRESASISVFDNYGRLVEQVKGTAQQNIYIGQSYRPGIYYFKVILPGGVYNLKGIKH